MPETCLITGASGGIGAAIAEKMAARGFSLFLHYFNNRKEIEKIAHRCIEKYKVPVEIVQADLRNKEGVDNLLHQLPKTVDVFIHNSGISQYGLLTDIPYEEIEKMMFLHLTSAILVTQHLLPGMLRKQKGNIILMSSIWGLAGASCEVIYSTVKGGMNAFVKALAKEVGPMNIRVNGVAPGAIATKMMAGFSEEEISDICGEIPLSRLGKPEEVANLVNFLISEEASYITGQIISVNGGWYC